MKGTYEGTYKPKMFDLFKKQIFYLFHKGASYAKFYVNFSARKTLASSQATLLSLQISSRNFSIFSDVINCNANNFVQRQDELFKYLYLQKQSSLYILFRDFLAEKLQKYIVISVIYPVFQSYNS